MAFFRKRPPAGPAARVVLDPACGVPAAVAARDALRNGDWRSVEAEHGASRDWETRGMVAAALADLDPFDDWVASAPNSGFAHAVRGAQLTRLAWDVRGSGKAAEVARDAWGDFFAILGAADQSLLTATDLAPDDPYPWFRRIWTGTGLQVETDEKLRRFNEMRERAPGYAPGWTAIISSVALKWGGSHELMFDVARDGDRTLPPGSLGRVGLTRAHYERWLYLANWEEDAAGAKAYYRRPEVVAEIAAAASNSVLSPAHRPSAMTRLGQSWFAYALALCGDADKRERVRAAGLFEALGDVGVPDEPWRTRYGDEEAGAVYVRIRSICRAAAGLPDPPPRG